MTVLLALALSLQPLVLQREDPVSQKGGAGGAVAGDARSGIAAKINGEIITWDEIELRMRDYRPEERTEELRRAELRRLADKRLFLQFAKKNSISVSDQEVDEAIKRDRKNFKGDEAFEEWLKILNKSLSEYREERRTELMIGHLYRRLYLEAIRNPNYRSVVLWEGVSPDELREYYRTHPEEFKGIQHVSFWRVALTFKDEEEKVLKRKLAESLLRKIGEGTDFLVLAHYYSEVARADPKTGKRLPPRYAQMKREESEFAKETTDLLFAMKVGDVSGIVEDRNTLNIFKMEERIDRKLETFEEAQLAIRARLESKKREENREILRNELLKQSYVEPADLFK